MSAGSIYAALGHDRIAGLNGIARALPVSMLAFALGGVALIGLPPSGAYLAKELLLGAATQTGQWWWAAVIQTGGILTSSYVLLVLAFALMPSNGRIALRIPVRRLSEASALALALCSLLLGLFHWQPYLPVPRLALSNWLALDALSSALWLLLPGALLAILLGRWESSARYGKIVAMLGPARAASLSFGWLIERADGLLRQWPAACLSLLLVAILLAAALITTR